MHIKKKRFTAIAMSAILAITLLGTGASTFAATSFSDTSGHWAEGHIISAVDEGYVSGYTNGTFQPDASITRAEFTKMINAACGYTQSGTITFTDVSSSDWYYNDVLVGVGQGYISGYANNTFLPNNDIVREEVAVVLSRISSGSTTNNLTSLGDYSDISSWALDGVCSSYNQGYLTGYTDGKYYPKRSLTRAEAVKIINTMLGIKESSTGTSTSTADSLSITALTISSTNTSRATVSVTTGMAGTVYWVLIDSDNDTPTARQIYNKTDADGDDPEDAGNTSVTKNTSRTISLTGLDSDMEYTFCAVLRDSDGNYSSVKTKTFVPGEADDDDDSWFTTFSISSVTEDSAVLRATSDTAGTMYWVAIENGGTSKPTAARVKAGEDRSGNDAAKSGKIALTANTQKSITISGLDSGVTYRVYAYVAGSSEDSPVKYSSAFTTDGDSWLTTFTASSSSQTTGTLTVRSTTAGDLYWVVVANGSTSTPTASRVIAGNGKTGDTVIDSGDTSVSKNTSKTITISGLSAGTTYRVYGVVYASSSSYSTVEYAGFTTSSTTTTVPAPTVTTSNATNSGFNITVTGGTGALYYYVTNSGGSAPAAATVANSGTQISSGTTVSYSDNPGNYTVYVVAVSNSTYSTVNSASATITSTDSGGGEEDNDDDDEITTGDQ